LLAVLALGDVLEVADQRVRDGLEFGPLEVLETGRRAGVEGPLAAELDLSDVGLGPVGLHERLPVVEVGDELRVLGVDDAADDLGVVVPG